MQIHPVIAIAGADRFLVHDALQQLLDAITGKVGDISPARLDGTNAGLAEVLDEVRTLSLLGDLQVVVLDNADAFITANRKSLERYCDDPAQSGCLIFVCNSLAKNTKLYKIIAKRGQVLACEPIKRHAIGSWIASRSANIYGKKLAPSVSQRLRDQIGDSPGLLDAELSKLAIYAGDRSEITLEDVSALTGCIREEKIFAVTDALASGSTETALRNWEQVYATDRAAPARAIAGLAWGVRRLLQARRDYEGGTNVAVLARRLYTDPSVLQKRLDGFSARELEQQLRDLLMADQAIKTGLSTADTSVEKFIIKHSRRCCA